MKDELSQNFLQEIKMHFSILDNLAEGIIIADKSGQFLYFNTTAADILGIGLQNVDPSEWSSVYGCYYLDKVKPYPSDSLPLARAIRGEVILDEIVFIKNPRRPDGLYISINANPLRNGSGLIYGGAVIFRDITDSLQSEMLLKASKERAKAQFNGFPIPTYVWQNVGDDFFLTDFNDAARAITKGAIAGRLGAALSTMYADLPEILADFQRCFDEKITFNREILYRLKSTGDLRDLIATYVYVHPDLVMVHTEDVTERKRTESELKKLYNAVEQTADLVLITDKEGIIEYVNPAFETITGFPRDEAVGKKPHVLKSGHHDKKFYKKLWGTLLKGKPFLDIIINKKKNGELFWCEQTITPVRDPDGNISNFVSVAKDITQLKQKQEMEFQLAFAHKIQQQISNATISVPGFDIAGKTYAAVHTAGDFYDFIPMADDCIGIVIADICGKGIGAALIMAETRAYLRAFAKLESDPAIILDRLNNELFADLEETQFVTLVFARLDPRNHVLYYANAGHSSAYLLNSAGAVEAEMPSTGIPLGYIKDWKYENGKPVSLSPASVLLFMTDGIGEAHNSRNTEFGDKRAIEIIKQHQLAPAEEIVEHLYRAVVSFSKNQFQEDDITSVICKVNPGE